MTRGHGLAYAGVRPPSLWIAPPGRAPVPQNLAERSQGHGLRGTHATQAIPAMAFSCPAIGRIAGA